jgi:Flp pilus assembly protein TadD
VQISGSQSADPVPGTQGLLRSVERVCFGVSIGVVALSVAVGFGASVVKARSLPALSLDGLVQARALEAAGDLPRAFAQYRRAAVVHGGAVYSASYGLALLRHGQVKAADAWLRNANRIDPTLSASYSGLGEVAVDEGRFDDAVRLFERALVFEPASPGIHNELGVAHALAKRFPEAVTAFTAALKLGGGQSVRENLERAQRDASQAAVMR